MGCSASAHFHFYNTVIFYFADFLRIFMTFNRESGVYRARDSNHRLCSGIHQVKFNNFLDRCSYGDEACWADASGLNVTTHFRKTSIFQIFFTSFWQHKGKNEFHSCLSHLNFAEGAIILTLLIFKPTFWASHPKKHRNRVHDHDSDLQTIFWKISLFLHI